MTTDNKITARLWTVTASADTDSDRTFLKLIRDADGSSGCLSCTTHHATGETIVSQVVKLFAEDYMALRTQISDLTRERDEALTAHEDRGFDCERLHQENTRLRSLLAKAEGIIGGLLMHCGIADSAPEDKDEIDQSYERSARLLLSELRSVK